MNFPGQYAPPFGEGNIRTTYYILTEDEQERAIKKLQDTLLDTKKVSVEFGFDKTNEDRTIEWCVKKHWLFYDHNLATELSTQLYVESESDSCIPTLLVYMSAPEIVFTLYPSEVKINIMVAKMDEGGLLYVTLGKGFQRWEGGFSTSFTKALLNAQLQDGETVWERCLFNRKRPDRPR